MMVNKLQRHFLANKQVHFVPLFILVRDGKNTQSAIQSRYLSSRGRSTKVSDNQEHENTGCQHSPNHDELVLGGSPLY